METKFTPGPWEVETLHYSRDHNLGIRVNGDIVSGYAAVLNTRWPHVPQQEEQYANARLIAAAPELFEALVLLEREMVESGNAGSTDYGWKPAIEKTRAALAKATGEKV